MVGRRSHPCDTARIDGGVIGQIIVARRQANLQEASTYRDQASAWLSLRAEWERVVLVGLGPHEARRRGAAQDLCDDYATVLGKYRIARVDLQDAIDRPHSPDRESLVSAAFTQESLARGLLAPYELAVRRVLIFLAQTADLVLRGRLSLLSIYDAVAHDVLRESEALNNVTTFSHHSGGCMGPWNQEGRWWRDLSLDDVSRRYGWAQALSASLGSLERIDLL